MDLTKRNVKDLLGIGNDAALSRYFNLTRGAAFFWEDDEPIPEAHQLTLLKRRPDLAAKFFNASPEKAA
jgi:hypothetical protein